MKYRDLVTYNGQQLFSGAIDLDNYLDSPERAREISASYVFHGSKYHVGAGANTSENLTDSIKFLEIILNALDSNSAEMILGIAGYGVGKSHFALMLASLLSTKNEWLKKKLLNKIEAIDEEAALRIEEIINEDNRPFLVIPINGMNNANLKDLFFSTAKRVLEKDGISSECLDKFDPRFEALEAILTQHKDTKAVDGLLFSLGLSRESFSASMKRRDNSVYSIVLDKLDEFKITFFPPAAIGDLKDIIQTLSRCLCGDEKPYRSMLIIFDEFGKYMSFSAINQGLAGIGCMQQLFEGVTGIDQNDGQVVLLGLSQLDLKEYQRGIGDVSSKNNMDRYVTRFDVAKRYFLSACFETLVANLIQVKNEAYKPSLEDLDTARRLRDANTDISTYFKASSQYVAWSDLKQFNNLIGIGCWPLSPFLMWTLTYITSVNNLLQQRSGLNILGKLFDEYIYDQEYEEDSLGIPAVRLFDAGLGMDIVDSERAFASANPIGTEYYNFYEKYKNVLKESEVLVLQAILLTHKLAAFCANQEYADNLLSLLTGLKKKDVKKAIESLSGTYNSVSYNSALKLYEIQSDSVSSMEFGKVVRDAVSIFRATKQKSEVFYSVVHVLKYMQEYSAIFNETFKDIECDFGVDSGISTGEWYYKASLVIGYDYLRTISGVVEEQKYQGVIHFDRPRGLMFYVVLPSDVSVLEATNRIKELFENRSKKNNLMPLPIMAIIISDSENKFLNAALEAFVIDHFSADDKKKYASLVPRRLEQLGKDMASIIQLEMQKKRYVYPINETKPLRLVGAKLFGQAYHEAIPFSIDGTNWLATVGRFDDVLAQDGASWNSFVSLGPAVANRAKSLLSSQWGSFDKKAYIRRYPEQDGLSSLFEKYDKRVEQGESIKIVDFYFELMKHPYGANSTAATLMIMLYCASRYGELDFFDGNDAVKMNSFFHQKRPVDSKYRAFIINKINDFTFKKAIRDDAKWISLVNRWKTASDMKSLISFYEEAASLKKSMISIPALLTDEVFNLNAYSLRAVNAYNEWESKRSLAETTLISFMNSQYIGRTIYYFNGDYRKVYEDSIGKCLKEKPVIKVPQDIKDNYESFCKIVKEYIESNIDCWVDDHPIDYRADKTKFDKLMESYEKMAKQLDSLGLIPLAIDLRHDIDDSKKKRKYAVEYIKIINDIEAGYKNISDTVKQGIFAVSQVSNLRNQVLLLIQKAESFPSEKLELIAKNLAEQIGELKALLHDIDDWDKKKNQEFEDLLNKDIESLEDLECVLNESQLLIKYFEGKGEDVSVNLDDAKLMNKECKLLKEAYDGLSERGISISDIDSRLNDYMLRIDEELDGDSIFNDEAILENFASQEKAKTLSLSKKWASDREMQLESCKEVSDFDKLIFTLETPPQYAVGAIDELIDSIIDKAKKKKSEMNLEYVKELYEALSDSEKTSFKNWLDGKKEKRWIW